ncbi:hypothetical protein CYY_003421 [Polysphondylium violaceum]|uniref:CBS domain-containing protein n=1 Tax=Polysphondylium violaceum TaxID=133409 RepID=A0A8J4PWW8_9MYCE|nr:hypothetical protein CYY_003421 [Polysphondylium violaceum]
MLNIRVNPGAFIENRLIKFKNSIVSTLSGEQSNNQYCFSNLHKEEEKYYQPINVSMTDEETTSPCNSSTTTNLENVQSLLELSIEDIPKLSSKNLITLKRSDSIDTAFKTLSTNDISCCPVMDPKFGFIGIIDTFDIVACVLSLFNKNESEKGKQMKNVGINYFSLSIDPISVVMRGSNINEQSKIMESNSVFSLLDAFDRYQLNRVMIYQDTRGTCDMYKPPVLSRIISQKDLFKWIWNNPSAKSQLIECCKSQTIESIYSKNPTFVTDSTQTIEVLKMLHISKISSIAVVNDKGRIKNEISTNSWKRMKGMNEKNIDLLFQDCSSFLQKTKKQHKEIYTCSPTTNIDIVWDLIARKGIRRVWVLNEKKLLIGVVTISDLFSHLKVLLKTYLDSIPSSFVTNSQQ